MQTGNHIHEYREKAADCDVLNDNVKKYNKEFNALKKDWMSKKGGAFSGDHIDKAQASYLAELN